MPRGTFKDHFSAQSELYARYRPGYPPQMFEYLASLCARHARAWDCASGSGQAACLLAPWFDEVIASDASERQIASAIPNPGVRYVVAPAEESDLDDGSVDLVTVGQALHWFDAERFFAESKRVLVADGVLAVWCYESCAVSRDCNAVIDELYSGIVGEYWPPERRIIESGYADFTLPGVELAVPEFDMQVRWSSDEMLGYLRTWSACQHYENEHGEDPVSRIEAELGSAWGDGDRLVTWPLRLRVCRV